MVDITFEVDEDGQYIFYKFDIPEDISEGSGFAKSAPIEKFKLKLECFSQKMGQPVLRSGYLVSIPELLPEPQVIDVDERRQKETSFTARGSLLPPGPLSNNPDHPEWDVEETRDMAMIKYAIEKNKGLQYPAVLRGDEENQKVRLAWLEKHVKPIAQRYAKKFLDTLEDCTNEGLKRIPERIAARSMERQTPGMGPYFTGVSAFFKRPGEPRGGRKKTRRIRKTKRTRQNKSRRAMILRK